MRKVLKEALKETVQDLINSGVKTSFTEKVQKKLCDSDDEYVNVKDTEWYKNIKAKVTPGETVSFYRKMHKITQKELGEKLGNFSKQNVSEMERNIRPISKKTAKQLSDLFNISIDRLI